MESSMALAFLTSRVAHLVRYSGPGLSGMMSAGMGVVSTPIPADIIPESPGPEYRTKWATLDVKKANAMLDSIGLSKKDSDGFRLLRPGRRQGLRHVDLNAQPV